MLRLILFTIFGTIIAAAAVFIAREPGFVVIEYYGYEITTSVTFLITSVVLAIILIELFILKPLGFIFRKNKESRNDSKNTLLYAMALAGAEKNDTKEFNKNLRKLWFSLRPIAKDTTLVLEAIIAKKEGQKENLLKIIDKLIQIPEFSDFAYKEKVEYYRNEKDNKTALALSLEAYNNAKSPWVYADLVELEIKEGRFETAEKYLEEGLKNKAVTKESYNKLKSIILLMLSELPYKENEREDLLALAHKLNPLHTIISDKLAQFYISIKKYKKAQSIIEDNFKRRPALPLYRTYIASLEELNDVDKLKMVEKLVANLDSDLKTFIMADIYMKISLWGQAWNELKKYIENHELTPALCKMLSRVEQFSGMQYHVSECVAISSDEHTFDTWICEECGRVSASGYKAQCETCGAIGSIEWHPAP